MAGNSKKPRADAVLKSLSEERQAQVIEWCDVPKSRKCAGGYKFAKEQLAADGVQTSIGALSEFYSWWHLRQDFAAADAQAEDFQELLQSANLGLSTEQIETAGRFVFTRKALINRDSDEFREMQYLKLAQESAKTKADFEAQKIEISKAKLAQKDREIALAQRRIELLEANAAKAKEQLVALASKGGLTPEALAEIEEAAKIL